MQVYWFATGLGRNLGILPLVHLKGEERWIPRSAAFLKPPDKGASLELGRWNHECSTCHTTDPRARWDNKKTYDTKVSEFGIACEACHGPAEAHVNFQRGRKNLAGANLTETLDPIVNPSSLDHRKSSQVCGACHVAHMPIDPSGNYTAFIPGNDYHKARRPLLMSEKFMDRYLGLADATNKTALRKAFMKQTLSVFWPDGTIRIGGREYNGLLASACYTKGQMSCLSCHNMHQSGSDKRPPKEWADDQLQSSKQRNTAAPNTPITRSVRRAAVVTIATCRTPRTPCSNPSGATQSGHPHRFERQSADAEDSDSAKRPRQPTHDFGGVKKGRGSRDAGRGGGPTGNLIAFSPA